MRWLPALALGVAAAGACGDAPTPRRDAAPARPFAVPRPLGVDCEQDRDCTLLPELTCCGECPPVPPFEAIAVTSLDAVLIELENKCARLRIECEAPKCPPWPPGCYARGACEQGQCVVEQEGCAPPRSP
jgi:hypothetical protein